MCENVKIHDPSTTHCIAITSLYVTWRQSVKNSLFVFTFSFLSRKPWWGQWRARWTPSSRYQVNRTPLSRFLEQLYDGRLLLDVVLWCCRHSVPQKEKVITFSTCTLSRTSDVVYTKLCFMSWSTPVNLTYYFFLISELMLPCKNNTSQEKPQNIFIINMKNYFYFWWLK